MAKSVGSVEGFEIFKAGRVTIVYENDEFFCNLRPADRGYHDPIAWARDIVRVRAEAAAEWAAVSIERKARLEAYLAARRGRVAASPQFQF